MQKKVTKLEPIIKRKSVTETSFKRGFKRAMKRGCDMTKIEFVNGEILPKQYKDHIK